MYKKDKYAWLLAGICILSLFLFLGESLFNTRGEPREAVVALSMLEKGNWILPINNGVDMAYKPPLFHWCIAAISTITGSVSEYTSRMPSALALAMMVMAGFAFYAKRRGTEVAFLMVQQLSRLVLLPQDLLQISLPVQEAQTDVQLLVQVTTPALVLPSAFQDESKESLFHHQRLIS